MEQLEVVNTVLRCIALVEGAFIIVGHLFVFVLFYHQGIRGKLSGYHILALMLTDFLQGILNVPLFIYLTRDLRVGDASCFWSHWLGGMSALTQIFTIITMTLDRYWAIVHTINYKKNATKTKTFMLIAAGWCCGIFFGVIALFFREIPNEPDLPCVFSEQLINKFLIAIAVLLVILPSNIVMAVLYVKIYRVIIASMREFSPGENTLGNIRKIMVRGTSTSDVQSSPAPEIDAPQREKIREFRTMIILTMILSLYFIGWIPSPIFYVFLKLNKIPKTMYMIVGVLNFLHSALNPFIYALNIKERKVAAKSMLKTIVCRNV